MTYRLRTESDRRNRAQTTQRTVIKFALAASLWGATALLGHSSQAAAQTCQTYDAQVLASLVHKVRVRGPADQAACEFGLDVHDYEPSGVCPLAVGVITNARFVMFESCANLPQDIRRIVSQDNETGKIVIEGLTD